jgi:hypothetical protein
MTVGSAVRFYVNGMLYGESTISENFAGVKAYEVLTYGSNKDGASFVGIISFDNTYLGEKIYTSPTILPDGGDSNISGDDMDGDSWDTNN